MATIYEQREKLLAMKRELEQGEEMSEGVFTIRSPEVASVLAAQIKGDGTSWIEVMPAVEKAKNGSWLFTITTEDLRQLAADIGAKPDRISVDYDHASAEKGDTRAAGWFTGEARVILSGEKAPNGDVQERDSVWAAVKWTPKAVQEIRDGEFRFVSAEFAMKQRDKKSGLLTQFKDLMAATLTNRPFFKDLAAVKARHLMESEQIDALSERYGSEISALVLAANDSEDEKVKEALTAVLAIKPEESKPAEPKAEEPKEPPKEEPIMAEASKPPDYLRLLGLDETADPKKRIQAALEQKDDKIIELETQVTTLRASEKEKSEESDELKDRLEKLEARDRERDIEVILARAVTNTQILPAEKENLAEVFAENVDGLRRVLAARPAGLMGDKYPLQAKGVTTSDFDRFVDDPDVAAYIQANTYEEPIDTESAKVHLQAMQILKDKGKEDEYTPDDYIKACEEASKQLVH